MKFAFRGDTPAPWTQRLIRELTEVMTAHGHHLTTDEAQAGLVFHTVNPARPRPFRRKSQATFVAGLISLDVDIDAPLQQIYPLLVRSLSNIAIAGATSGDSVVHLVTPELGHYTIRQGQLGWENQLYEAIAPLASSHLVIDNVFDDDLPPELWDGNQTTDEMRTASRTLASWDLFPAPYPIRDLLPGEDLRHLKKVFGIGGLSYGNLSARESGTRFWMSASGVDKSKIGIVSQDILLVKGYDAEARAMRLSRIPGTTPHRVSVDAVEHWGIYRAHPEIGALIHIHAWVEGVPTTSINYPCGTVEMGEAMSALLDQAPHPERTIIGLKNHGITATGPNFPDILERLAGRVKSQVPMQ